MALNVTGKPKGERGARQCRTCIWWKPFPVTSFAGSWDHEDWDRPNDEHGACNHPQFSGWRVRTRSHWCDGWVPDMSKV